MVVAGTDKLICDLNWGYCEYYDLTADPGEKLNLAEQRPGRLAQLRGILDGWLDDHVRYEPLLARGRANPEGGAVPRAIERGRLGDLLVLDDLLDLLPSVAAAGRPARGRPAAGHGAAWPQGQPPAPDRRPGQPRSGDPRLDGGGRRPAGRHRPGPPAARGGRARRRIAPRSRAATARRPGAGRAPGRRRAAGAGGGARQLPQRGRLPTGHPGAGQAGRPPGHARAAGPPARGAQPPGDGRSPGRHRRPRGAGGRWPNASAATNTCPCGPPPPWPWPRSAGPTRWPPCNARWPRSASPPSWPPPARRWPSSPPARPPGAHPVGGPRRQGRSSAPL